MRPLARGAGDEDLVDECGRSLAELLDLSGKRGHIASFLLDFSGTPEVGVRAQRILNACSICAA